MLNRHFRLVLALTLVSMSIASTQVLAKGPQSYLGAQLRKPIKPKGESWRHFFGQAFRAKMALAKVALRSKPARRILYSKLRQHRAFKTLRPRTFASRVVATRASTIQALLQRGSGVKLTPKDRQSLGHALRFWDQLLVPGSAPR